MKKLPTLHILNGDASVPAFTVANLPGHVLVWREILASGPAVYNLPEKAFWGLRQRYITTNFKVLEEDYEAKVLNELPKLENAGSFFEVVLWFDQDLVCQINLLYLLYVLSKHQPAVISVCTPETGSIGYKSLEQLQNLFEHRQQLEASQLQQAAHLWQLYGGPDPKALQTFLQENQIYSDALQHALMLHLQRFPRQDTFLGKPQHLLLKAINDGASTLSAIQESFWQQDPGYGFGDWQLQALLKELSPELVSLSGEAILLTERGKLVLEGKSKFKKDLTYWLGGVQLKQSEPAWYQDATTDTVIIYERQS